VNTPLLVNDQHDPGSSRAQRQPAGASRRRAEDHRANGHLETPTEALDALAACTTGEALTWFTHYLRRRDRFLGELTAEEFASVLETLATDFRTEATAEPTRPHATGLSVAAAVVSDTAAAIRADELSAMSDD
jgi:hypothetical protein